MEEKTKNKVKKSNLNVKGLIIVIVTIISIMCMTIIVFDFIGNGVDKPIIYIYPEVETEVKVVLGKSQNLTCTYPKYEDGWTVNAKPDGTLTEIKNPQRNLYSLYYEAKNTKTYGKNLENGFVVKSDEVATFLEDKLSLLGLNYKESEEFIIYWLPKLEEKKYVYIRFQTMEEIEKNMPLYIDKKPDTLIRVMMEWKCLDKSIDVEEQELTPIKRSGFTVVEWGGTPLK